MVFCIVRNKFSPYVENGNSFWYEYAAVIAYASVSRTYAGKERPRAERLLRTERRKPLV